MAVVKKGNRWYVVLELGRDPKTGKRKQRWVSSWKTKREALKDEVKKKHELAQGAYVIQQKITLKEYLLKWLNDYARNAVKPTTLQSYTSFINTHIIPSLGNYKLQNLKPIQIQKFYTQKLENGRVDGQGGLSPQSVRYIHAILRKALGHAVKWQIISQNPAEFVDPPSIQKKAISTLSLEETQLFLSYAANDRMYIAFLLAVTTGLRRGEILGLRWKDIDFERKTASIRQNLVLVKNKPTLQEPKTNGSVRMITLPSITIKALKKHKQLQEKEKLAAGEIYQDYDLITATSLGTPINPRNLLRSFKRLLKKAGLPDIRLHDIRHTHATLMLQQGEHPKIVSERLGHSDTRVTLNTYSHVLPNMQRDAVDRFEKLILQNNPPKNTLYPTKG